ncbi:bifunctional tetrahydrofolate synthase/dihydrofolate synthase [Legionella sp. km772]|uniref:bifunctional tetrahydrofolate synthase/dihydrofolate synthase n=1 Tax=Legionella sp. km772 TaxID=2498111 RepID=UPI000F8DF8A0|nr:bifunctional tetrahydrofolate synthase/dihydrofolate synthase [Legionella sp. km772]RUR09590.1 bifunctional tetrahydrofolate synthase/dihydrofolate synthase [Legionella sp. km772]
MDSNKFLANQTLNEWLNYLEKNSPSHKIQLGLERIAQVAKRLNVHCSNAKVITIAGTNGKGSTVNALECIYHSAGYKVGSYTSPHLIYFNERIKINLTAISDEALCEIFSLIETARGLIELTYFEVATLAALVYFSQQQVDVILLEVGLGGRLDATNIIDSDLAIITTIDYDHQEYLGTTLNQIAYEKAGILRQGKPFVYADNDPPLSILTVAENLATRTFLYGRDFNFSDPDDGSWCFCTANTQIKNLKKPLIQLKSASAAIMACKVLESTLPLPREAIAQAMNRIFVPGRLQVQNIEEKSLCILYDVSHNAQSVQLLAKTIRNYPQKGRIHAVFSALKYKDILGLINSIKDCIDHWYLAQLDNPRGADAEYLLSMAKKAEILAEICYTSPLVAFEEAMTQAKAEDLIVVFGSFFTVSQVMSSQHKLLKERGCYETGY